MYTMENPSYSLADLVGRDYTQAVCQAQSVLSGVPEEKLRQIAEEKVEFAPPAYRQRLDDLVDIIGQKVCAGLPKSARGAGTVSFERATNTALSPLSGLGFVRVGEDGRAYLIAKSEHYHASLGHAFPGYRLLENAKRLGIPNATHNNTRGHITRLLEEELVRVANGIPPEERHHVREVLVAREPHVLNRVINLETGSLVVEAALKMLLARFYRLEDTFTEPVYAGRIPVFLVIGDYTGGKKANYHGTTILTQVMRGMWPEFSSRLEESRSFVVRTVQINDSADFERVLLAHESPPYKVAGFFHEIILMNYGAIRLDEEYLQQAYQLCQEYDVPTVVDEIQSCAWSPEFFLFREYGLQPDFVSTGKGFPGGEYPASRILTTAMFDNLNQFGALVTNGQEEIASLAYLVTMTFVQANRAFIREVGNHYESELKSLARKHSMVVHRQEGWRHMSSLFFYSVDNTVRFVRYLNEAGIDISAQTYKAECPPAALTKLPLIATHHMVDFLIHKMDAALRKL